MIMATVNADGTFDFGKSLTSEIEEHMRRFYGSWLAEQQKNAADYRARVNVMRLRESCGVKTTFTVGRFARYGS